ncbi:MAG: hypothetical protein Q3962_06170 [Corynebacterium sp.]|nr:hypothetical protein [Corynebacterium sp.]
MLSGLLNLGLSPRSPKAIHVGKNSASAFISCQQDAFRLRGKLITPSDFGQGIADRMAVAPDRVLGDFRKILGGLFDIDACRAGDDFADLYHTVVALSAGDLQRTAQLFDKKNVTGVNYCDDLCRMWLASLVRTRIYPNHMGRPAFVEWFNVGRNRQRVFNRAACCEFTGARRLAS